MNDKEIIEKSVIKGKEIIAKRIIEGLRYCEVEYPPCSHCPYRISGLNLCKKQLIADAYYLVKKQEAEIKERRKVNTRIVESMPVLIEVTRAEAIKEFAEKLKEMLVKYDMYGTLYIVEDIDNLVKEMVGA